MKKILSLSSLATLAIVLAWGSALNAQTAPSTTDQQTPQQSPDATPSQQTPQTAPTPSPEMPPSSQQTPSSQTPSQPPSQTPDATAPDSGAKSGTSAGANGDNQTFSGTVVKQGDKYVLKDDAGKVYDIDHQTDVAKFEGKRVRVQGTLDANGKIMVK